MGTRERATDFPWLGPEDSYQFPSPELSTEEGIVGVGGNLSPGMLLSAYRQGIFPWFNRDDPVIWWCPDPRFVVFLDEVHVSRSLQREMRGARITVTLDQAFPEVVHHCATTPRPRQRGTWITEDMELAYRRLHELGYAHSCEVWDGTRLVGGTYGVSLGRMFFGESMFHHQSNASKIALVRLARFLQGQGFGLIDSQLHTSHMERMGGRDIPRREFLGILHDALKHPTIRGNWGAVFGANI